MPEHFFLKFLNKKISATVENLPYLSKFLNFPSISKAFQTILKLNKNIPKHFQTLSTLSNLLNCF